MKFNQCIYIMLCLAMFGLEVKAELPDSPPKKWPCDQVYNPKLDLKALWQGWSAAARCRARSARCGSSLRR